MDASPLSRLPAELRVSIYELCLTQHGKTVRISYHDHKRNPLDTRFDAPAPVQATRGYMLALLQTCRLAYQECSEIVYNSSTFRIVVDMPDETDMVDLGYRSRDEVIAKAVGRTLQPLYTFTSTIGSENAAAIRSIIVDFDYELDLYESPLFELSHVMEGTLLALSKIATEKPEWHLRAKFVLCLSWAEQYTIEMSNTAAALKRIADEMELDVTEDYLNESDKSLIREGMGYVRRWEAAAAAFENRYVSKDASKDDDGA